MGIEINIKLKYCNNNRWSYCCATILFMEFIFKIAIIIYSIIIHEIAHGYAALALGDRTAQYAGRLTLNPIKHIDLFGTIILPIMMLVLSAGTFLFGWAKPVPYNPYNLKNQRWGGALVALAGPASNILIAGFFVVLIHVGVAQGFMNQSLLEISVFIVLMNFILAFFNMIPIPPLDGSKVLFSILPYKWHYVQNRLERYGFFIILFFIMFFGDFFFNFINWTANLLL
jgi:Zn-dependent protease